MEDVIEYEMDSDMEEIQPVVPAVPVQKRSRLLILMGLPKIVGDGADKYEEVQLSGDDEDDEEDDNKGRKPKWNKVLNCLKSNPKEASICDDSKYPLDDALWIQKNPVPVPVSTQVGQRVFLPNCVKSFSFDENSVDIQLIFTRHVFL